MEICKVTIPWLKALNKHSISTITRIMYIDMENVISNKKKIGKKLTCNVDKDSSVTVQKMHTQKRKKENKRLTHI